MTILSMTRGVPTGISRRQALTALAGIPGAALSQPNESERERGKPAAIAAFLYVGEVGVQGWSFAHEVARRQMQRRLGGSVRSFFYERVPESQTDGLIVINSAVQAGANIIFGTSFGHGEAMKLAAEKYPLVRFEHCTGIYTSENLRTYNIRYWEGTYLAGMLAAGASKTGKIGVVGSIPIPEILSKVNAFTLGAQSINPSIRIRLRWADDWYNPNLESAITEMLFSDGADIVFQTTDSQGPLRTAQRLGKLGIGIDSDMSSIAPEAHIGSVALNWSGYYAKAVTDLLSGSWREDSTEWGLREGAIDLVSISKRVDPAKIAEVMRVKSEIVSSGRNIWVGPIYSQAGRLMANTGDSLTPRAVETMNWFVRGVDGYVPSRR